ncbi:HAD family hydrolase [Streptomyces triticirhizae]|uniref:Hydrolase n=1 Tax=Streptomyces triticirhizae TaxID=2483353 RepID=A0A3M2MG28_9ACTN|nr:hypothetical protein [Streptomyces triticirhizae]RMI46208.1 hypothetical protein EBN88_01100 [Streptomyces triticirhizae]
MASGWPSPPFRTALDPGRILTPADKVTAVDRVRTALGLGRDSRTAYGDSGSDIPLFRELSHTVAVNADDALRQLARCHYDGDDLWAAYRIARSRSPERGEAPSLDVQGRR